MSRAIAPVTALALLLLVSSASATIVVQKSIAGVKLGMTEAKVKSVLGSPTKARSGKDAITGQPSRTLTYGKTTVYLIGQVMYVRTTSATEKTSGGVGVGSTETVLKQKVKSVKCSTTKSGKVSYRICSIGKGLPGQVVTTFGISTKTKKIESVLVGRVVD